MQQTVRRVVEALKRNAIREARDEQLFKGYTGCFMYTKAVPDHIYVPCEYSLPTKEIYKHKAGKVKASFVFAVYILNKYFTFYACGDCTLKHMRIHSETIVEDEGEF